MKIALLFPAKAKPAAAQTLIDEYAKRCKAIGPCEILYYKEERVDNRPPAEVKSSETKKIYKLLKDNDYLVACDERGIALSTESLVSFTKDATLAQGKFATKSRVVIVIGGALGLSDEIRQRADTLWSLSGLVMAGSVARVILAEALYRALTIIKGHPYHNV